MIKFIEQIKSEEKEKYIKDIQKNINFETYPKVRDFILNNDLYITNVKTGPIELEDKNATIVLDNSQNRWFVLCVDGKVEMLAKKNTLIHTNLFSYSKRDTSFNKKYKISKKDYLIEYVDNIGANLSLALKNYNDKIGKGKWEDEENEITSMFIHSTKDNSILGYTYNSDSFSLCSIGKNSNKRLDILN